MDRRTQIFLLMLLVLVLISINYRFFDSRLEDFFGEREFGVVERIIDGDTIVVNNESVRLLGINSAEKGEPYYEEAKEFLEEVILDKGVELRFGKERYDRYDRLLAYVYVDRANINLELVEEGYANLYFPSGKDEYYDMFMKSWEKCLEENVNLCEKSVDKCANCVKIAEFGGQEVVFENICEFDCSLDGWEVKDEGRKKFVFNGFVLRGRKTISIDAEDFEEDYVWTETGDTLFLRDGEGKLVLWEEY